MKNKDRIPGLKVSLVRDAGIPLSSSVVDDAKSAASVARGFVPEGEEREHFMVILLDARRNVKGVSVVSIGTLSASLVHPREVFRPAIVAGAAGIVVSHNHPSGDASPSPEDRDATNRLKRAGDLIGIPVLDHVIIGAQGSFYSFREHGIL